MFLYYNPEIIRAVEQDPRTLKRLLERGDDPNTRDERKQTPLRQAVAHNQLACVRMLIAAGSDINYRDGNGGLLSYVRKPSIAQILIENGAPLTFKDHAGRGPLFHTLGHPAVLELLLLNFADSDQRDNNGMTPLMIACQNNNLAAVKVLDSYSADWDAWNRWGKIARHYSGAVIKKWYHRKYHVEL